MLIANYYKVQLQCLRQRQQIKVEKQRYNWVAYGKVGCSPQSNRLVLWMNFNVCSSICLFTELEKSLSPYNNSCNNKSFARSTYLSGRNMGSSDTIIVRSEITMKQ